MKNVYKYFSLFKCLENMHVLQRGVIECGANVAERQAGKQAGYTALQD